MRSLQVAVLLLLLPVASLVAQDSTNIVLADTVVLSGSAGVSYQLDHNAIYLITVRPEDAVPVFLLTEGRADSADLARISSPQPGIAVYEVYPPKAATYRLVFRGPAGGEVHYRLTTDAAAMRHRIRELSRPSWGIGLTVRGGYRTGYRIGSVGEDGKGGALWEAALAFGNGRRLSASLGVARHGYTGDANNIFWVYLEPRFAVLQKAGRGNRVVDLGVLVRLAQGHASRVSIDPFFYGAGAFASYRLSPGVQGRGFAVDLSALYGGINNVKVSGQSMGQITIGLTWIP